MLTKKQEQTIKDFSQRVVVEKYPDQTAYQFHGTLSDWALLFRESLPEPGQTLRDMQGLPNFSDLLLDDAINAVNRTGHTPSELVHFYLLYAFLKSKGL